MKNNAKRIVSCILIMLIIGCTLCPVLAAESTKQRVVRIACGMNDALYINDDGEPAGSCIMYIRQLAWNNNWKLEYVEGSYNESLQRLYDGDIDLMFPVGADEDPDGKLLYSDFIGGYQQIGLFARADDDIYYEDYEGFNNKKVGISIGSNSRILDETAAEHDFTYEAVPLNSIQDKINALNNKAVDLIAFSTLNTVEGGKLVAILDQVPFYFCTSIKNADLMEEINAGMSKSMITTPDVVSDMYYNVLKGYNTVSYTKEEHEKIQSMDKIVVGVYGNCLPLAGYNSDGELVGIYVDLMKVIAEQTGLNIEFSAVKDDNKLYSALDDGSVDFVIGELELRFSQDNSSNHLASNGLTSYTAVAVSKSDYQFEADDKPVIALTYARQYLESYIYSNFKNAQIEYYDTRRDCLMAVETGKVDATFMDTREFGYESKNPRFRDLLEWENIRVSSVVSLGATTQSDMEILSIFEKAISQMSQEKVSEIITYNMNIKYQNYTLGDRLYMAKNAIIIGVIILILIMTSLLVYILAKKRYIKNLIVANNAKSEFLSRMSHELRTPINAISGYTELIEGDIKSDNISTDRLQEYLKTTKRATNYLLAIIGDILDIQNIEAGKIQLIKHEVNIEEYMNNVIDMIRQDAKRKNIEFTYERKTHLSENYIVDGVRLQQVLLNILYNAIKFTPEGGKVTMTLEAKPYDEELTEIKYIVTDSGIGMSKEFMDTKLFEKFAQENTDISSPYEGCGTGLAISKQLIELMDGNICCDSEKGKGTTFTITFLAKSAFKRKRRDSVKQQYSYDLNGIRVLLCEDNAMNQDMEKRILEKMQCVVDIAADGKIGVDMFSEHDKGYYDIILMDIRMPNMDGLEATTTIRGLDRDDAKTIPILAVSANAFEEDVKKSLAAGMNEHLAKPVGPSILYEKIKLYCKKN